VPDQMGSASRVTVVKYRHLRQRFSRAHLPMN